MLVIKFRTGLLNIGIPVTLASWRTEMNRIYKIDPKGFHYCKRRKN